MEDTNEPDAPKTIAITAPQEDKSGTGISFQVFLVWLLIMAMVGMIAGMWAGVHVGEVNSKYNSVPVSVEDLTKFDAYQLAELQRRINDEYIHRLGGK